MVDNSKLNKKVIDNFLAINNWFLIVPIFVLLFGYLYFSLFVNSGNLANSYVDVQKDLFFYLNSKLSEFSNLEYNLTQLGDALIIFPLVTIFIIYAPKLWEGLLYASIISLVVSAVLKKLFAIPRPAAMFDRDAFVIIGKTLSGHNSLPSGHSMTTLIVITTLLFAFMPKKNTAKIGWFILVLSLGLFIAFSRVGVGAHYPIDVLIGSTIGFILAVIGIKISNSVNWLAWIKNKKSHLFFIIIFPIWIFLIGKKIITDNTFIYYISIIALLISLFIISKPYVKKTN